MQRRELKFNNLDDAIAEIHHLRDQGYDRVGNWSLEENLEHLNKTMRMAVDGPQFFLPALVRPLLRWFVLPKMRRGEVVRFQAKAPDPLQPESSGDLNQLVDEFETLAKKIMNPEMTFPEKHPVFGKISASDWRANMVWHAAHHLSFLIPTKASANVSME